MSRQRLTVVLSQAQGKNPAKRALEESIAAALIMEPGLDVSIVPYLYDLDAEHTGRLFLESVQGDMVVLALDVPARRLLAARPRRHQGPLRRKPDQAAGRGEEDEEDGEPEPPKGIGAVDVPDRHIYCSRPARPRRLRVYVEEVRRIAAECRERRETQLKTWIQGNPTLVQLGRYLRDEEPAKPQTEFSSEQLLQQPGRRWYPVIDYSRCTNCMECLDFCLFGVYGVDKLDRLVVENQDNCKRGCPACSRVCPEQAIMFPDYKTPAIAGAPVGNISGLKIDLTQAVRRRRRLGDGRAGARPRTGRRRPARRSA